MPRFSFGQTSGDYGNFFADLYASATAQKKADDAQAKYDAAQAKAEAKAQQTADDNNAYDEWSNGITDDDTWLAYIDARVSETTDPKEHEHWVELSRQYHRSIEDNTAYTTFQNGGSINDYIAYQQGVLTKLDPGSQAYRKRQSDLSALIDQRAQQDVTYKAQKILSGIETGDYSYKDLLQTYKAALAVARPGTDFYNQLESAISDTQGKLHDGEANGKLTKIEYDFQSGKITGAQAGKMIRSVAAEYYGGDQQKLYQLYESALNFERVPGKIDPKTGKPVGAVAGGSGGGGGSRGGGGGGGGGGPKKKTQAEINRQLQSQINSDKEAIARVKVLEQQYQEVGPGGQGKDPLTGQTVTFTPKLVAQLHKDGLAIYDHLYTVQTTKKVGTATTVSGRAAFVSNYVIPDNTVAAQDKVQATLSSAHKLVESAKTDIDPSARVEAGQKAAALIDTLTVNLVVTTKRGVSQDAADAGLGVATTRTLKTEAQQVDPKLLQELQVTSAALKLAADPGSAQLTPEQATNLKKQVDAGTGTYVKDVWSMADVVNGGTVEAVALQDGSAMMVVTPEGPTVIKLKPQTQTVLDPTTGQQSYQPVLGILTEDVPGVPKDAEAVAVYIDFNGKPTKAIGYAVPVQSQYKAWVVQSAFNEKDADGKVTVKHAKGEILDSTFVAQNQELMTQWAKDGVVDVQAIDLGFKQVIVGSYNDNGKTVPAQSFVRDPETGVYFDSTLPIKWASIEGDGTITIKDGKPVFDWQGMAHLAGMPVIYTGDNPKAFQAKIDTGEVDTSQALARDALGKPVPPQAGEWAHIYSNSDDPYAVSAGREKTDEESQAYWRNVNKANDSMNRAQLQAKANDLATGARQFVEDPAGTILDAVDQLAERFGITVGNKRPAALPTISQDARDMGLKGVVPSPPKISQDAYDTGLKSTIPSPGLSSGPTLSPTLPKPGLGTQLPGGGVQATATFIPAPKITAPNPTMAQAQVTLPKPVPKPAPKPAAPAPKTGPSEDLITSPVYVAPKQTQTPLNAPKGLTY